jgi:hypothetical protein
VLTVVKNEAVAATAAIDAVTQAIALLAGITIGPGVMPGGVEIRRSGRMLGQVYPVLGGAPQADLILAPERGESLVAQGRAAPNSLAPLPGWVTLTLATEADVANAIALFREAHERRHPSLRAV